jgi:hypothetical protein
VLFFVERHTLMGRGLGFVDVHLLASVALDGTVRLSTRDKRLRAANDSLRRHISNRGCPPGSISRGTAA